MKMIYNNNANSVCRHNKKSAKIAVQSCWGFGNFMHAIALPLMHIKNNNLDLALTIINDNNCGEEKGNKRNIIDIFNDQFNHGIKLENENISIFNKEPNRLFRGFNFNVEYEKYQEYFIGIFKPSNMVSDICNKFLEDHLLIGKEYISMNIRSGDYATYYNNTDERITIEYFEKCLESLPKHIPVIVNVIPREEVEIYKTIFSDDRFIFCDISYPNYLPIISNAKYCIISNSTYYWWGAYLNKEAKKVIYPYPWFRVFKETARIQPNWSSCDNCYSYNDDNIALSGKWGRKDGIWEFYSNGTGVHIWLGNTSKIRWNKKGHLFHIEFIDNSIWNRDIFVQKDKTQGIEIYGNTYTKLNPIYQ